MYSKKSLVFITHYKSYSNCYLYSLMITYTDFKNIPTNFRHIALYAILSGLAVIALSIIVIFTFWGILGSGVKGAAIANKYQAELIIKYGPLLLVSLFLLIKARISFNKSKLPQFKTYIITLLALLLIFIISAITQGFY